MKRIILAICVLSFLITGCSGLSFDNSQDVARQGDNHVNEASEPENNDLITDRIEPQDYYVIQSLYPGLTFNEWLLKDKDEFYETMSQIGAIFDENDKNIQTIKKDDLINDLYMRHESVCKELNKLVKMYHSSQQGLRIYDGYTTGALYALRLSLHNHELLINMLKRRSEDQSEDFQVYADITPFSFNGRDTDTLYSFDGDILYQQLIDLLEIVNSEVFPEDFFNNLSIFIFPYSIEGISGFASSDKRPYIVLTQNWGSYSSNSFKSTVLHELGHIYSADIMGRYDLPKDKTLMKEYSDIYDIETHWDWKKPWDKQTDENFAEDFSQYYMDILDIDPKPAKDTDFPYEEEEFKAFMAKTLEGYKPREAYPDLYIKYDNDEYYEFSSFTRAGSTRITNRKLTLEIRSRDGMPVKDAYYIEASSSIHKNLTDKSDKPDSISITLPDYGYYVVAVKDKNNESIDTFILNNEYTGSFMTLLKKLFI